MSAPPLNPFGDYGPDRYAWLLQDVRRLERPIPVKGALALWEIPPGIEWDIQRQLKVA